MTDREDMWPECFIDDCRRRAVRSIARHDAYSNVSVVRDYCAVHADTVEQIRKLLRGNGENDG